MEDSNKIATRIEIPKWMLQDLSDAQADLLKKEALTFNDVNHIYQVPDKLIATKDLITWPKPAK